MKVLFKDYVKKERIFDFNKQDKYDLLHDMAKKMCKEADIFNDKKFADEMLERERQSPSPLII